VPTGARVHYENEGRTSGLDPPCPRWCVFTYYSVVKDRNSRCYRVGPTFQLRPKKQKSRGTFRLPGFHQSTYGAWLLAGCPHRVITTLNGGGGRLVIHDCCEQRVALRRQGCPVRLTLSAFVFRRDQHGTKTSARRSFGGTCSKE